MTAKPLISIVMPAHNAARFIADSIDSVLRQTYLHWELIIVDDASSDTTPEIVAGYDDPRIRYHRVERIGSPSGVRNVALKQAQGELIAFLDADDLYYPNTLETLLKPLSQNPELAAVFGFAYVVDEDGVPMRQPMPLTPLPTGGYSIPQRYQVTWENIVTGNISCLLAGLMLRKATLDRVGFFNEALCGPEDYEFFVRLFLQDFDRIQCLPDYMYEYRVYGGSLTKDPARYEKVLNSVLKVMTWLFTEAPLPAHVKKLQSMAIANSYRYLSRERIMHKQPELGRKIALMGLTDPLINRLDWVHYCLPLIFRSLLPSDLDNLMVDCRWAMRNQANRLTKLVRS
jgi:glycosyltransferase involved in cell wall biosynthesis